MNFPVTAATAAAGGALFAAFGLDFFHALCVDRRTACCIACGQVPCAKLQFAFECVVLENAQYPNGYLDYHMGITGNTAADCDTYADNFDTNKCNVVCAVSGGSVQARFVLLVLLI